ncbi:MAG: hypothetical protein GY835_08245 [bacterium]|nr:hypothetical protein [bacterium]
MIQRTRSQLTLLLLILIITSLVSGCGTSRNFIQRDSLYSIDKQMCPQDIVKKVEREPISQYSFDDAGVTYLTYRYNIRVASDNSDASSVSANVSQYNARMGTNMSAPSSGNTQTEAYFFVFKDNRLCFHGLLEEMKETPNREVRDKSRMIAAWFESNVSG